VSPFALYLRWLRETRQLKQYEVANMLGYEPTYLSALERSEKGPPRRDFLDRLIRGLKLDEREQTELVIALQASKRHVSIPAKASEQEYRLLRKLELQLGHLHALQIQLIEIALDLPCIADKSNHSRSLATLSKQAGRKEASEM
jgi:transcriptional regulator with XRE-family HTH domain